MFWPWRENKKSGQCHTSLIPSERSSMVEKTITTRIEIRDLIKELVIGINYPSSDDIIDGLIDIINKVSDYHEEGQTLYPEVLVVNNLTYFNTFLNHRVKLVEKELKRADFSQCIKMCAPLAVSGWNIYVALLEGGKIEYGLLTSEMATLSLDLYEQTMNVGVPEINALYIRNAGNKVVEVRTVQIKLMISLNLNDGVYSLDQTVDDLVQIILDNDNKKSLEKINFLNKIIRQALNEGHGNLIAVSEPGQEAINSVLSNFHGGITLETPINLSELANDCMLFQTEEASLKLSSYAGLLQSMLNFDGITLFSNDGKIIGYHYIVNNENVAEENIEGGSRSRAYSALCSIDGLKACFMKSQDGKIKFKIK